jgi:hypothetical protein
MKYPRVCPLSIMTLIIFSTSNDLRAQSGSQIYRYSHCDCAFQLTDQIRIGSKDIGIRFHEQSDEQALQSFRSLKYGVWLGVVGQLYVVGTHDAGRSTFRLEHWYTIVPFTEYWVKDWNTVPHEVHKVNRNSLRRSDFKRTDSFDPDTPTFHPSFYQRKRTHRKRAASQKAASGLPITLSPICRAGRDA